MEKLLGSMIEKKKIAILGYGREGKSTLKTLLRIGEYDSITILDKNANGQDISDDMNVTVVSGDGYQDRLDDFDIVIKSPGVVLDRDIQSYRCDIVSQTELFMRRYKGQVIGITGTKGKSTTTTLLYHILENMGWDAKLAGNVGIPSFDIIDDITENTTIVYELSSHMLEYMSVSPRIGVILNIYEEHLDHYGTMEKYVKAKKNILTNQEEGDICFLHSDIHDECKSTRIRITTGLKSTYDNGEVNIHKNVVTFCYNEESYRYIIPTERIGLMGEHNYYDVGVAYAILKLYDVSDEEFEKGLISYSPLPHRLEYIGEIGGIKYYNDSISTICQTTIQAVETIPNIATVIVGGMDRGIDYTELIEYFSTCDKLKNIIFMYETGKRIYNEFKEKYGDLKNNIMHLVENLTEAVDLAVQLGEQGEACVMSPAAASYGYFTNFEERGREFIRLVKCYKN